MKGCPSGGRAGTGGSCVASRPHAFSPSLARAGGPVCSRSWAAHAAGRGARARRWCKGNLQNTFSRDCTLFDSSQPIMLRILWNAVTWHYLTCSVYTPTFLLVPILAILVGIFPIALNRVFALAFTLYFCMQQIVRAAPPGPALSSPNPARRRGLRVLARWPAPAAPAHAMRGSERVHMTMIIDYL